MMTDLSCGDSGPFRPIIRVREKLQKQDADVLVLGWTRFRRGIHRKNASKNEPYLGLGVGADEYPLEALIPKIPFSFFFLPDFGSSPIRGPGVSLGRILVGGCTLSPFLGSGGGGGGGYNCHHRTTAQPAQPAGHAATQDPPPATTATTAPCASAAMVASPYGWGWGTTPGERLKPLKCCNGGRVRVGALISGGWVPQNPSQPPPPPLINEVWWSPSRIRGTRATHWWLRRRCHTVGGTAGGKGKVWARAWDTNPPIVLASLMLHCCCQRVVQGAA